MQHTLNNIHQAVFPKFYAYLDFHLSNLKFLIWQVLVLGLRYEVEDGQLALAVRLKPLLLSFTCKWHLSTCLDDLLTANRTP